jgi:(p)ppGpp synthase/HD superfamily hydrolase
MSKEELNKIYAEHPDLMLLTFIEKFLKRAKNEHRIADVHLLEKHLIQEVERHENSDHRETLMFLREIRKVLDAFNVAFLAHQGQKRESGEPFIAHPVHVALYEIYHEVHEVHETNIPRIVASLLHDTVEDTTMSLDDIEDKFGKPMRAMVDNLTQNPQWKEWVEEGELTKIEEAALQYTKAARSLDTMEVKISDRLDNLRTLQAMPDLKCTQKVADTITVGYVEKAVKLNDRLFLEALRDAVKIYMTDKLLVDCFGEEQLPHWQQVRDFEMHEIERGLESIG